MSTHSFLYGDERIIFERMPRRGNKDAVQIKVHPDGAVRVHAPTSASEAEVLKAVKKRSRWIYQQLRDFRELKKHSTPRQYLSGESHYYLGKQYLLKVYEEPDAMESVKMLRGKLEVRVRQRNRDKIRWLLEQWYRVRARDVFQRRLDALLEQTLWVKHSPMIHLRNMQTQWGSCSPSGRITLNPNLVKAPRECVDYVILHELCHLAEHNHSERFYRLLTRVMPEWEPVKDRLDALAPRILAP